MLEKNYTNPADRGRFGFSMSGEYRSPYKAEGAFVLLLWAAAAVLALVLFFVLSGFIGQTKNDMYESAQPFILLSCAIAVAIFAALLAVIFGVGVRSVKKGFKCHYSANDETFTATVGGDLHVIHYSEVTSVKFDPRSSFGKIRGYDVIITIKGREQVFSVCSDGYLTPQATPFYIIQERVEILRRPSSAEKINTARANAKAITRAEVDRAKTGSLGAMDRMAQLLGETSSMQELSASPVKKTAPDVSRAPKSYSSDAMPAIGQAAAQPMGTYLTDDGRQRALNDIQTQGVFYIKPDPLTQIALTVLGMIVSAALGWVVAYLVVEGLLGGDFSDPTAFVLVVEIACMLAAALLGGYHTLTHIRGKLHHYRADGRGFFVSAKGEGDEAVLFKDVLSVDYSPTKLLWFINGYKVDILTKERLIHYDYIFPDIRHRIARQNLPFEVIRKNIPEKEQED